MEEVIKIHLVPVTSNKETGGFVSGITNNLGAMTKGKGIFGDILKTFSGLTKGLAKFAGIAGVIVMILQSSKLLQRLIKVLSKTIGAMIGAIMDMVGLALLPLVYALKPLTKFLRLMMLPYKKKMMDAMKAGNEFYRYYLEVRNSDEELAKDFLNRAVEGWALAMAYAFKPLLDIITYVFQLGMIGIVNVIFYALEALFENSPAIVDKLETIRQSLVSGIVETFESIREGVTNTLDQRLDELLTRLDIVHKTLGTDMSKVKAKLDDPTIYSTVKDTLEADSEKLAQLSVQILGSADRLARWQPKRADIVVTSSYRPNLFDRWVLFASKIAPEGTLIDHVLDNLAEGVYRKMAQGGAEAVANEMERRNP